MAEASVYALFCKLLGPDLCRLQESFKEDLQLPEGCEGLLLIAENLVDLEPKLSVLEEGWGHRTEQIVRWAREVDNLKNNEILRAGFSELFYGHVERDRIRPPLYLTSTILAGQRQPLWPVGRRCGQTAEAVLVFLRCSVCARFL